MERLQNAIQECGIITIALNQKDFFACIFKPAYGSLIFFFCPIYRKGGVVKPGFNIISVIFYSSGGFNTPPLILKLRC